MQPGIPSGEGGYIFVDETKKIKKEFVTCCEVQGTCGNVKVIVIDSKM